MYKYFVLAILAVAVFSSCKKDPIPAGKGSLALHFYAYTGDDLLVMNQLLDYNGKAMRFSRFNFFISDITLIGADGDTKILDIAGMDFTGINDATDAAAGNVITIADIVEGDYTALKLGIGVSPELNAKKPTDFDSDHPLSKAGDYWDGWESYIFSKIEGLMDTDGNGSFERGIAYHTGSDEVYRIKTLTLPIEIKANQTAELSLKVDLWKVLTGIDISEDDGTHLLGDIGLATIIMDNFAGDGIQAQ